jgi:hypothetical protein
MPTYKIFSLIIIVMVTVFGIVTFPFLGYSNYDGDLTRMGMLPEKYFGWTAPQPKIDNTLLISSSWVDADILVIGDSFSEKLIWQSKLVQAGYKVRTENWASVGQICNDFNDWLNVNNFQGRYVIVQSVENSFSARLKKSVKCNKTQYKFLQKKEIYPPPELIQRTYAPSGQGQLYAGVKTWLNQLSYEKKLMNDAFDAWDVNENVKVKRVKSGCELFSHPHCDDVLFFRKVSSPSISADLENVNLINARLPSRQLIWLVIPDKSSVYLDDSNSLRDLNLELRQSINVLDPLREAINRKEVDVYFGNDTHLSPKGYGFVGDSVLNYLKRHP